MSMDKLNVYGVAALDVLRAYVNGLGWLSRQFFGLLLGFTWGSMLTSYHLNTPPQPPITPSPTIFLEMFVEACKLSVVIGAVFGVAVVIRAFIIQRQQAR